MLPGEGFLGTARGWPPSCLDHTA